MQRVNYYVWVLQVAGLGCSYDHATSAQMFASSTAAVWQGNAQEIGRMLIHAGPRASMATCDLRSMLSTGNPCLHSLCALYSAPFLCVTRNLKVWQMASP